MGHRRIILEVVDPVNLRIRGQEADWFYTENGDLIIQVGARKILDNVSGSIFSPEIFLYAFHELVEAILCKAAGVDQEAVDDFDKNFYGLDEAGDHPDAPYREQHRRAMILEHLMANWLGITGYGEIR